MVCFGDSFGAQVWPRLAAPVTKNRSAMRRVNWEQGNGLSQIMSWLRGRLVSHARRAKRSSSSGSSTRGSTPSPTRATQRSTFPWNVANWPAKPPAHLPKSRALDLRQQRQLQGPLRNFAYLFSPTAFKMTDTCVVPLKQKFFDCSYGNAPLLSRRYYAGRR